MKYYIISIFILFCLKLYPQSNLNNGKTIKLPAESFLANSSVAVSGIQLLLTDTANSTLGYLPAAQGNETFKLVSETQKYRWQDSLINRRYGGSFVANKRKLIWLLRNLSLTTDSSGKYYFTHLKAEVFRSGDNQSYQKLLSIDTVLTGKVTGDNSYSTGIRNAIDALYTVSLNGLNKEQSENHRSLSDAVNENLSENSIADLTKREASLPIVTDTLYNRGAYISFAEFTQNSPSVTDAIWAEPDTIRGSFHVKVYAMGMDSAVHELTSIWGVCFGSSEIYKLEDGLLIPIEVSGENIVLSRYQTPMIRKNQAFYWHRVIANSWPSEANPFSRKQTITIGLKESGRKSASIFQPIATRVDTISGELTF